MSKQLYEEALADVKKLKEVAEDNAKRAILEAVTPRIRDLIENELMGVSPNESADLDEDDTSSVDEEGDTAAGTGAEKLVLGEEGKDENGGTPNKTDASEVYEMSYESISRLGSLLPGNKSAKFSKRFAAIVEATQKIKSSVLNESKVDQMKVAAIISEIENMYAYLQETASPSPKRKLYEDELENCYRTLKQLTERKTMKNKKRLTEMDLMLKLTNLPEDVTLDDLGVEITPEGEEAEEGEEPEAEEGAPEAEEGAPESEEGDEAGDEESGEEEEEGSDEDLGKMESRRLSDNVIVEIDERMLRREITRMKSLREASESGKIPKIKGLEAHGAGKVATGFEDDDLGDPILDIDLSEGVEQGQGQDKKAKKADGLDEVDGDLDEQQLDEMDGDLDEMDLDEEDLDEYGGVDEDDDMTGMDESDLDQSMKRRSDDPNLQVNVQSDMTRQSSLMHHGGMAEAAKAKNEAKRKAVAARNAATRLMKEGKKAQAKRMSEAYTFYARRHNEAVNQINKLKGTLNESAHKGRTPNGGSKAAAEAGDLRTKLSETNLFNAKLLYANKTLQNESLTKRQKAQMIERLDEARSIREAKLIYESLTSTLQSAPRQQMTESTNRGVVGSSSRIERPASTLTEGFEADRWARLAGIIK